MNKEQIIEIFRKWSITRWAETREDEPFEMLIEQEWELIAEEILALSKDTPYVGKLDNSKPTYQERRLKNV